MEKTHALQKAVSLYAGSRLKELRGEESRVKFGERIEMKESLLHTYEVGQVNIPLWRLAKFAALLDVPLSTFILPDDDPALAEFRKEETEA